MFARHRIDIGITTQFKVRPTTKTRKPVYTLILLNVKRRFNSKTTLTSCYCIITTLRFSQHASPIFTECKPVLKMRLQMDLRKTNELISENYSNNYTISTLSVAAQHLARKNVYANVTVFLRKPVASSNDNQLQENNPYS